VQLRKQKWGSGGEEVTRVKGPVMESGRMRQNKGGKWHKSFCQQGGKATRQKVG